MTRLAAWGSLPTNGLLQAFQGGFSVDKGIIILGVTVDIFVTSGGTHFSSKRDSNSNQFDRGVCVNVEQVVK